MKLNGYVISHNTNEGFQKILDRIRELGKKYLEFRNYKAAYLIKYNGIDSIYIETGRDITDLCNFLGYGFEGLYTDEEKFNEIEEFGKYRCIIERVKETIDDIEIQQIL